MLGGMARRLEGRKPQSPNGEGVAVPDVACEALVAQLGARSDHLLGAGQRRQLTRPGHIVVVQVCLDDMADPKVALPRRVDVHVHVAPRVDHGGDARLLVRDQRREVPQAFDLELPEQHDPSLHRPGSG